MHGPSFALGALGSKQIKDWNESWKEMKNYAMQRGLGPPSRILRITEKVIGW